MYNDIHPQIYKKSASLFPSPSFPHFHPQTNKKSPSLFPSPSFPHFSPWSSSKCLPSPSVSKSNSHLPTPLSQLGTSSTTSVTPTCSNFSNPPPTSRSPHTRRSTRSFRNRCRWSRIRRSWTMRGTSTWRLKNVPSRCRYRCRACRVLWEGWKRPGGRKRKF